MRHHTSRYLLNALLLLVGVLSVFSGVLIQFNYHMGHHGGIASQHDVLGIGYTAWTAIHKISIVVLSILMVMHLALHAKWYLGVFKKRLFSKNRQVLTLTIVFLFVALTGLIPWAIDSFSSNGLLRKGFIEIHDKLALILTVYLILHVVKRAKWYFKRV